jgi:ADP-heptose:LPS heptosyltransferase
MNCTTEIVASLKQRIASVLAQPATARWAAPVRTFRQVCGWNTSPIPLAEARKILVIRPDEIGDVVLTTPFLRALRQAAPRAQITLLVKNPCRELVEHCAFVNSVLALNFNSHDWDGDRVRLFLSSLRLRLSRGCWRGFDLVLLPRRSADFYGAELVAHLLAGRGAVLLHRERPGQCSGHTPRDARISFQKYSNPEVEHEVVHGLRFAHWCGAGRASDARLELSLTPSDRDLARTALKDGGRYVALAPGAGDPLRCWPIERFSAIATWLHDERGMTPVLLGGRCDPQFACAMNFIGRTTLRQAAAVLERCELFVGNDSGLKHIAAATGIPVVEISGFRRGGAANHANSPSRFHAWGVQQRVVRPPEGPGMIVISEVTTDAVRTACTELLGSPTSDLDETPSTTLLP